MIILAWNRDIPGSWDDYEKAVAACRDTGYWSDTWSVGRRRNIPEGIECYLLGQGKTHPRGLLAKGIVLSEPYPDADFRNYGDVTMYVDVMFIQMLPVGSVIPLEHLNHHVDGVPWLKGIRGSGYTVSEPAQVKLARVWAEQYAALT